MTSISRMSAPGEEALIREEGEVLRAYRCPAGVWTIGVGLTAASGVIKPKSGMVITKAESRRLLRAALERNYEPRVRKALPTRLQNVFDGATMFDFNTGRIHNASWVKHFIAGTLAKARHSFLSWNKAGGKVLAGLTQRRTREWNIIEFGNYAAAANRSALSSFSDYRDAFARLGYDVVLSGADDVVRDFQRDHKLEVDGKIGPATRAAIQRALEARLANRSTVGSGAAGTATGAGTELAVNPNATEVVTPDMAMWAVGGGLAIAALVFGAFLVWRYRGPLFSRLPEGVKDFLEENVGIIVGRRVRT